MRACVRSRAFLLTAAALLIVSCGTRRETIVPGAAGADQLLFERGSAALKERRWTDARDYFTRLIDGYPNSAYRSEAKLGMGDVYLEEGTSGSLVFAQNEFREFLNFYPTSPRADYAQYKLAMTHVKAMRGPGRDQTETTSAIRELEGLLQRFPMSELAEEVRMQLRDAKDRRGQHEFGVGLTYYRLRAYAGALGRFTALIKADPEYTYRDAVYFYLAETLRRAENTVEALPYYERLVAEFEKSDYLDDARERIAELKRELEQRGDGLVSR